MRRRVALVYVLLALALPAAADDGFGAVVKGIEAHYGIRRLHPHLIGFTMFLAKPMMWGSGAGSMKVAVFEEDGRSFTASLTELDAIVAKSVGRQWRPFVRVDSRRDGEATVIYTSFSGKHMRMLIATVEHDSIAVVHMKISKGGIRKWMADPEGEAKDSSHPQRDKANDKDNEED